MRRIFVFGDSVAFGRGVKETDSWASKMGRFFDAVSRGESLIFNLGIPGETSIDLNARFEEEIKARIRSRGEDDYNVAILATGINDAKIKLKKPQVTRKDFVRSINKIIDVAEKYSDKTIFVGPIRIRNGRTGQFKNKFIEEYNGLLKTICFDRKIKFIDIFGTWPVSCVDWYCDDGVHPNKMGHKYIAKRVINELGSLRKEYINPFPVLKNELALKKVDFKKFRIKKSSITSSDLFLGHVGQSFGMPDVILGGPCIRKDIDKEGISLNTFYQIFLPIKIASLLKRPCRIYLGLKEELILSPEHSDAYTALVAALTKAIHEIATNLKVDVSIIDTSDPGINKIVEETLAESKLNLSEEESEDLYSFSPGQNKTKKHTSSRILTNKRVVTCHSLPFLRKATGYDTFLIVEDFEQIKTYLRASRMSGEGRLPARSDFLAFLPLPNIFLSSTMFKAKPEGKIYLSRTAISYGDIWRKSCPASRRICTALLELMGYKINRFSSNRRNFISGMDSISHFFG
jgi:lysophospholipase L1-like esterase